MKKTKLFTLAMAGIMALSMAGCSGEKAPEADKPAEATEKLIMATNAAFPPYEFYENEKIVGIDAEIAEKIAEKLGKTLEIVDTEFGSIIAGVQTGKYDIGMAGLTVNEERKEYVTFTDPYYKASQKIIVTSDNTEFDECKTPADVEAILNAKDKETTIGVQNGTTGQLYVLGDADWGFDGFKVECKGYSNGSMAVQDMLNGNVDYVIIDAAPAACIVENINALS